MRTQQLLMCTLLLLSAVPCFAQENISSQERQKRREAIIAMPPRQRDILTKNFNEFRSLTPEQRDAFRQLLGEINQHHDRDKLTQALKNYHDWLKDLGEKYYLELQEIKDPEKKLQRIKEITAYAVENGVEALRFYADFGSAQESARECLVTARSRRGPTGVSPSTRDM